VLSARRRALIPADSQCFNAAGAGSGGVADKFSLAFFGTIVSLITLLHNAPPADQFIHFAEHDSKHSAVLGQ
jgi:hypothetical protein